MTTVPWSTRLEEGAPSDVSLSYSARTRTRDQCCCLRTVPWRRGKVFVDQLDAPPIEEDGRGVFHREGDQLGPRIVVGGSDDSFGDTHRMTTVSSAGERCCPGIPFRADC